MKSEITLNESVKEAMEIALIKLLQKKDINKITVTELTELAGVGRSSFYRNFASMEDAAVSYVNRIYREYFRNNPVNPNAYKKSNFSFFLRKRYKFIREHKDVFTVLHKNGILYNVLVKMDSEVKAQYLLADVSESRYFSAMIMGFSAGVIEEWVAGGMKESEEELAEITKACLMNTVKSLKDAF
ncbi:MAG: TetR/AcrR family transcriptional regulator [Oscillospiraceae bacterium]|nr:TetR/AcrR family transcriptional regulator [Oscillospiraceae bacterium]MBQ4643011.1 TetR/AcrR family transcriptional regulator [Oscillospiraceae bacterium]